jgi:hypothetical protein
LLVLFSKIIQNFYSFLSQPFPFWPIFGLRPCSRKSASAPPSFRPSSLAPQQATAVGPATAHQLAQLAAASPTPPPPTPQPMIGGPHLSSPSPRPCSGRTRLSPMRRRPSPPLARVPVRGPHAKGSFPGYLRRRHTLGPLIRTLAATLSTRAAAGTLTLAPPLLPDVVSVSPSRSCPGDAQGGEEATRATCCPRAPCRPWKPTGASQSRCVAPSPSHPSRPRRPR